VELAVALRLPNHHNSLNDKKARSKADPTPRGRDFHKGERRSMAKRPSAVVAKMQQQPQIRETLDPACTAARSQIGHENQF
jgi:hypothetical protein